MSAKHEADPLVRAALAALERRLAAGDTVPMSVDVLLCIGESVRARLVLSPCLRGWARDVTLAALQRELALLTRAADTTTTSLERTDDITRAVLARELAASAEAGLAWFAFGHDTFPSMIEGYPVWKEALWRLEVQLARRTTLEECARLLGDRARRSWEDGWLGRIWRPPAADRGDVPSPDMTRPLTRQRPHDASN